MTGRCVLGVEAATIVAEAQFYCPGIRIILKMNLHSGGLSMFSNIVQPFLA